MLVVVLETAVSTPELTEVSSVLVLTLVLRDCNPMVAELWIVLAKVVVLRVLELKLRLEAEAKACCPTVLITWVVTVVLVLLERKLMP